MRTVVAGSMLAVLALTGCIEHRPPEQQVSREPVKVVEQKPPKGLRVYEGNVPCADCRGIHQRLALKGDSAGVFRLTETYRRSINEDGDAVIVTTGAWKRFQKKTDSGELTVLYLSQGSIADSARIIQYAAEERRIVQIELDGETIPDRSDYTLRLVRDVK